jgi:hypothetical protein
MTWQPLLALLTLFGVATAFLLVRGRCDDRSPLFALLGRIPDALGRLTGQPGWAVATVGMSLFGLLVAGQGFYSDVAWHVAVGRDKELFTPPHTAIIVGLALIAGAAAFGIVFATLERVDTRWRLGSLRVPRSTALLGVLGASALAGFPLDDVWHGVYGIDVTMWSPTHMLMICGAALSGAASWLVLREAGIPASGGWGRALHAVTAWFALQGLLAPLGEFAFGVPQFDQVFHPLLLCLAGGVALVATRLVLGAGWALGLATVTFALDATNVLGGGALPVEPRAVGLYIGAAAAVELAALLVGTGRVTRFAVTSGLGIATIGLATDAWWNQRAWQPWRAALVPEALALGIPLAVAAAVLGCRLAGHRLPRRLGALAVAVVVVALAWPLPRPVGDVTAAVDVDPNATGTSADVAVTVSPADAADDARWFQWSSWQGGELAVGDLREVGPGRWVATTPVPIGGSHKTLLRLHRGHQMMTVPVYLPADPEIDEPEIPAVDRTVNFEAETRYLLRETKPGAAWFAWVVYALLLAVVLLWLGGFALAAGAPLAVTRRPPSPAPADGPDPTRRSAAPARRR